MGYSVLISYDMRKGMEKNPRRVQFTKGLYGYYYEWETKSGRKRQRKAGLLDPLNKYEKVGESTILIEDIEEKDIDYILEYFKSFSDVIAVRAFKVVQEIGL